MELIWYNGMKYNRPNSGIWNDAKAMRGLWRRKWRGFKWYMDKTNPNHLGTAWSIWNTSSCDGDIVGCKKLSNHLGEDLRDKSCLPNGSWSHFIYSPGKEGNEIADSMVPCDLKGLTKKQLRDLREGKESPQNLVKKYLEQSYISPKKKQY